MASCWIERRVVKSGVRYRVEYRLGGRNEKQRFGGSFKTLREAEIRKSWIEDELAAMRVPNLKAWQQEPEPEPDDYQDKAARARAFFESYRDDATA